MWDSVATTICTILAVCAGITCIAGCIASVSKLFVPVKKVKQDVEEHDVKLKEVDAKLEHLKMSLNDIDETNKVICKSLLVIMNHQITGNSVDKLKDQRDELEQFLINK